MSEDKESDELIRALLSQRGEDEDRKSAASNLGDAHRPSVRAVAALLRASLTDPEERVRIIALEALVRLGRQPQNRQKPKNPRQPGFDMSLLLNAAITACMFDESDDVRAVAVESAAQTGDLQFARELVARYLNDANPEVRFCAREIHRRISK